VKNLFSLRATSRLGKSLLPAALLAVFAVQRIARQLTVPPFSTARLSCSVRMSTAFFWPLPCCFCLGCGGLRGRVAQPRVAPEDEPRGPAPGVSKRPRAVPRFAAANPRVAAPDAAPQSEGRCVEGRGGADTTPPTYAVALALILATMERAPGDGQGPAILLAEEIKAEARLAGVPNYREPAAGALALPLGRSGTGDSSRPCMRR